MNAFLHIARNSSVVFTQVLPYVCACSFIAIFVHINLIHLSEPYVKQNLLVLLVTCRLRNRLFSHSMQIFAYTRLLRDLIDQFI